MGETRRNDIVEYRKSITVNDPDAYAEVVLKLEGLTEEATKELRMIFCKFYVEAEEIVRKTTGSFM